MKLSAAQSVWLLTHGNRTAEDVLIYKDTPCISMWDGYEKKVKLVAIPEDDRINYKKVTGRFLLI